MGIGTKSDFVIYNEEYYAGMIETIARNLNVFNGASAGAIRLENRMIKGDYEKKSFWPLTGSIINRRDPTSTSSVDSIALDMGEDINVKLNRRIGPFAGTFDQFKKIAVDPGQRSLIIGRKVGEAKTQEMIDIAISALVAAIQNQGSAHEDDSSGTVTHAGLVDTLNKFGDRMGDIIMWVMHSKTYADLIKKDISDKITNVASRTIYGANPASLGRPVLVVDSPSLIDTSPSPDQYRILGLTSGAASVIESETEEVAQEKITGLANIVWRIQGEYAYNLDLKGYKWDTVNGGVNPDDSTLGTGTNWDQIATSVKDTAGALLIVQ